MTTTTMIALVGEQPIPVLLPIRDLKPKRVALMHTDDTLIVARHLRRLIEADVDLLCVKPFDVRDCQQKLKRYLRTLNGSVTYNLTGGAKTMLLAAYTMAVTDRSAVVYLQTQGSLSRLYSYRFSSSGLVETNSRDLPTLITVDDYLRAHLSGYTESGFSRLDGKLTSGGEFEQCVADALRGQVDELLIGVHPDDVAGNIDIDFVIRCGNQVGIAEAKANKASKDGLDQLTMAGGREYLGIYTRKFLVVGNTIGSSLKQLAEARGIQVIELPSYASSGVITPIEARTCVETVRKRLGAKP